MSALRLVIHGRVQGVGYRQWLFETANLHKLHGWTRNLTDGTVEAVLSGPDVSLAACLAACHKGPAYAEISHIDTYPFQGNLPAGFEVKQTPSPLVKAKGKCL